MNKRSLTLLVCICTLFLCHQSLAQRGRSVKQRFNAGLVLGMNLSQLDGDKRQGYDKIGLQFGARGVANITRRLEISTGLLFSQKGSSFDSGIIDEKIRLNYMEVPILINFKNKYIKEKKLYRWQWFTGISVGRLISSSVTENKRDEFDFTATLDFLKTGEISHLIGINYYLDRHFAIGIQNSISLTKAYDANEDPIEGNLVEGLRNYLLNFRLLYMLW